MRLAPLIFVMLTGSLAAGELMPSYPLWNGSESVADYAKKVNLPPTQTLELGNGVKLELVLIPAGNFVMGTPEPKEPTQTVAIGQGILYVSAACVLGLLAVVLFGAIRKRQRPKFSLRFLLMLTLMASLGLYGGVHWHKTEQAWHDYQSAKVRYDAADQTEKPGHPVTLTQPFYMGKFVVTQEQYAQVIGTNPSNVKGKDNPVETVSWDDSQAFCKKLTEQTKQTVRLPTEAEWEYACRSGTATAYNSGDSEADLARVAWYSANSKNTTHPVGQKEPNTFGLYDMHGNVWQWCEDWYAEDYYGKSPAIDPKGPAQGAFPLLRGGSWNLNPMYCRSADRIWNNPDNRNGNVGFRVAVAPAFRTP